MLKFWKKRFSNPRFQLKFSKDKLKFFRSSAPCRVPARVPEGASGSGCDSYGALVLVILVLSDWYIAVIFSELYCDDERSSV